MSDAQRNVGALVFGEQNSFVAFGDFGGAADNNPMLGAMVVHL